MRRTSSIYRGMASTTGGMRRILKRRLSPVEYIEKAVKYGVFRPNSPHDQYNLDDLDLDLTLPENRRRLAKLREERRQSQGYPIEYEILSLNPPLAPPARMPVKVRRQQRRQQASLPTDELVKAYLKRHDDRQRSLHPPTAAQLDEMRYAKLLGLHDSDGGDGADAHADGYYGGGGGGYDPMSTALGRKSTVLQNAYKFALRQYETIRQHDGKLSIDESAKLVEQILAEEAKEERQKSRKTVESVQKWREKEEPEEGQGNAGADAPQKAAASSSSSPSSTSPPPPGTIPSILHSKPRTARALSIWGQRLAAVPYDRWTVGAATALDRWIAREILDMDDETYDKVLEGETEDDLEGVSSLTSRARDIVAVRGALFPETLVGEGGGDGIDALGGMEEMEEDEVDEERAATDRSIDELLASLSGGFDEDDDEEMGWSFDDDDDEAKKKQKGGGGGGAEHDGLVQQMVDELQDWRREHKTKPYEDWGDERRKEFDDWLAEYVSLLTTDADGDVDLEATRNALLSQPSLPDRDEADQFWSELRDETQAEIYLQTLHEHHAASSSTTKMSPADGGSEAMAKAFLDLDMFLSLPRNVQLRRLVDLGTLRPILDEYVDESTRSEFVARYAETFLEGVKIEHLVYDPDGPIAVDDLSPEVWKEMEEGVAEERFGHGAMDKHARFRIEKIPYGTDEFGTVASERARALYRAWNAHKAGRARYEEVMFKRGKLGLSVEEAKERRREKTRR